MKVRWELLLIPGFLITILLIVSSQYVFLQGSFHRDLGLGRLSEAMNLGNYFKFFSDTFYLNTLWITIKTSALATLSTILLGFPVAYLIARMRSRWAMILLAGVVVATFVTIVIKVFGLIIIFSADGWLNRFLLWVGFIDRPYTIIGNEVGVVVGLMHFTLGFGVLLLYSVIQTIPRSYEDAAQIHGASRWRVHWRIMLPLSLPGITVGALMIFNMSMGAFTSAALLGGGRVFTLPVLIQRTVMMEIKYAMAGTLAAVLLVSVILINLLSVYLLKRLKAARLVIA
ncbi:MAG: ABC transporter permease [Gammaproteobacteria bacterium]|nr:ABC transporter permease [Gammaproteobacteria bacterium]MDE0282425.1 ABC transporter permease [Gammaproteobacteria bacterium]MDE0714169.1 ABC transporter permease [Gammaproteobacteria bacterium]MXX16985.1 ABC transporter permease [Gammaproteobacteria bacterium]MXY63628.1 ABC transporter permease [Gammaproteobacteria bacterium]